jgi:hypothetical protein
MTDDIVIRLRKKYLGQLPICLEAADEIERLRKLGDALADTGGQHGFDEALDNWKDMRNV